MQDRTRSNAAWMLVLKDLPDVDSKLQALEEQLRLVRSRR